MMHSPVEFLLLCLMYVNTNTLRQTKCVAFVKFVTDPRYLLITPAVPGLKYGP